MTEHQKLWQAIREAGGIDAYVDQQLGANGWLVQRRETDGMSARELKKYKEQLRHEAAERKALQKQAWEAYRDTHIVFLGDQVYWQDNPQEAARDLPNAEERAAANEIPALDNPKQLAEALGMSVPDLRWFTYHRDAADVLHYRPFTIPKRDGSPRQIWAPMPRLKAAQRWILDNILANIPVHGAAHGFLPERSILTHARQHTNSSHVLRVDIEDFFPSVTFPRVKGVFRQAGYREQVATLLALFCTEAPRQIVTVGDETLYVALGPRCLPQGAPTSPAITNIACFRLDRRLTGLAQKQGWRYSRYADDLTFSLPDGHKGEPKLGYLLGAVRRIVEDEGFAVKDKKTQVARKGSRQSVTGLLVNGDGPPRVSRALKRQVRAAVHNLQQGKPLRDGETIYQLIGYAAFIAMVEPDLGKRYLAALYPFAEEASSTC